MFFNSSTPSTCTLQLRLRCSSLSCRPYVSGNRNDWPRILIYMVWLLFSPKMYDVRLALQWAARVAINKKNNNDIVFPKNLFFFTIRQLRRVPAPSRCLPIDSSNAGVTWLGCPVFLLFCVNKQFHAVFYRVHIEWAFTVLFVEGTLLEAAVKILSLGAHGLHR